MSEAREKIDSMVEVVLNGEELPISLSDLQGYLEDLERDEGVPWYTGSQPDFVYADLPIDEWEKYSADRIYDKITEERYNELYEGAEPTKKEIEMWREAVIADFYDDPEWDGGYILRAIRDSSGREVVALLHTSGGGWDYSESIVGVFRSHEEAREAIPANDHTILEGF